MAHIWAIEQLGVGDKWYLWFYSQNRYNQKMVREYLDRDKRIFPEYKFRIKKYVREGG